MVKGQSGNVHYLCIKRKCAIKEIAKDDERRANKSTPPIPVIAREELVMGRVCLEVDVSGIPEGFYIRS